MPAIRHLPPSPHPKVRQRSARACAPCRRRKIKCDGTDPCAACVGYGYDCVFNDPPPRSSVAAAASPARPTISKDASKTSISRDPIILGEPPKNTEPFMASETLVETSGTDPLILRAFKTRFTSIHSAVALPRKLGMSLGLQPPPRIRAFAWNPGTRPEPKVEPKFSLCNIITVEQMKYYSDIYFNEVHPYFGFLDKDLYNDRSKEFWLDNKRGIDFEACICGVVALGSYFSRVPLPMEADVVEQGKYLLDFSTVHAPAQLSIKHVLAWVLRALYLRSTTRPHLSWIASCTSMHIAEAIGLHRDMGEKNLACDRLPNREKIEPFEVDLRRRTFWVTAAFNQFLASEYGRTRVQLDMISCNPFEPRPGDFTLDVIKIMTSVPKSQDFANIVELLESLRMACDLPVKSSFLGLLRADACFCLYRMVRCTNITLPPCRIGPLLEVIRVALDGVKVLNVMGHPWWNIISVPFHCVCVLLSLGTLESSSVLPQALETLKNAVTQYPSHISSEALRTVYTLVQAAADKKKQEASDFDRALRMVGELPAESLVSNGSTDDAVSFGSADMGGFMDFLDFNDYYGDEENTFIFK